MDHHGQSSWRNVWYVVVLVVLLLIMVFLLAFERFPQVVGVEEEILEYEVVDGVLREERMLVAGIEEMNQKLDGIQLKLNELREILVGSDHGDKKMERKSPTPPHPVSQPVSVPGDTDHCWGNRLMILSSQRSGTHFLKSLLSMHPKTKLS